MLSFIINIQGIGNLELFNPLNKTLIKLISCFLCTFCRPRRRSGSSIVVLGADELNNKIRLPGDEDYMSSQLTYSPADAHAQLLYNQQTPRIGDDDMDMLSNQDNGMRNAL